MAKLGRMRTSSLISVYARQDYVPSEAKAALTQVDLPDDDGVSTRPVAVNEILSVLMELNKRLDVEVKVESVLGIIEEAGLG